MVDNRVQIRTKERVVKHGNEQNYFYGRIMMGFNEVLQDFANPSKNRTFQAVIRNVVFDEVEEDNVVFDKDGNSSVNGKVLVRKLISYKDKAYKIKYDDANLLYSALNKVVSSCGVHNEIKQFSLDHDTKSCGTQYPNATYENDSYDYSTMFSQ